MENADSPFTGVLDHILNWTSLVPILVPFSILAVVVFLGFIVIIIKRRKDRQRFDEFLSQADSDSGVPEELSASEEKEPEDKDDEAEEDEEDEDEEEDDDDDSEKESKVSGIKEYEVDDGEDSSLEALEDVAAEEESSKVDLKKPLPQKTAPSKLVDEVKQITKQGWKERLLSGLSKTRNTLSSSLSSLLSQKNKIDDSLFEQIHEALYKADIGVSTVDKLTNELRRTFSSQADKEKTIDWEDVKAVLKTQSEKILTHAKKDLSLPDEPPSIILIVGVNGVGKTTTIGKLAAYFLAQNKSVLLCAGDTFRAAAIEQLQVWGERLNVEVIKQKQGADPAAVAFDAVKSAKAKDVDIVLIDTAGRLHSKDDLMAELAKIKRVIGKEISKAPHEIWLVLDATTGQNALLQVKAFREVVNVTGLIVTKLDGTAKGGVLLGITDQFKLPIRFIGVGEKISDLRPFDESEYVDSIFD